MISTDPSGRAVYSAGLRPLACWDCGFESHRRHWRLSLVSVVCCQVQVAATARSLVQRSPTECGVSEWDREASTMRKPGALGGVGHEEIYDNENPDCPEHISIHFLNCVSNA
jgi:hypothetical protein